MAKMNVRRPITPAGVTHEGGPAKRIPVIDQLRRSVMACMLWEDTFYEDGQEIGARIAGLVPQVDPFKVGHMALEAREKMHLRHVPLLLVRELLRHPKRHSIEVGTFIANVIQRPDEMMELLAIYWKDGRGPTSKLPGQLKKGLAQAIHKFNAYQLQKWDRPGAQVRLRDVIFLSHPKPESDEEKALWESFINKQEASADTWETRLSAGEGVKTAAAKEERWGALLMEHKLGGMALIRNLRNMLEAGIDKNLIAQEIVRASGKGAFKRVLPFRFIAAAKHAPRMEAVLETAMTAALKDVPKLPGRTVLLVDNSGSMTGFGSRVPTGSEMTPFDRAAGLAILLREVCEDVRVFTFSDSLWPEIGSARRGFALRDALREHGGGGTALGSAIRVLHGDDSMSPYRNLSRYDRRVTLAGGKVPYERIIVITDEQTADRVGDPMGKGYVINVASNLRGVGYGQWTHIDGFSEATVRYIAAMEGAAQEAAPEQEGD